MKELYFNGTTEVHECEKRYLLDSYIVLFTKQICGEGNLKQKIQFVGLVCRDIFYAEYAIQEAKVITLCTKSNK
jgi:hypothetical protein